MNLRSIATWTMLAALGAARPAAADCLCDDPPLEVIYPATGSLDVATNARLLLWGGADAGDPLVTAQYGDGAFEAITGALAVVGAYGTNGHGTTYDVWAWTPAVPFDAGRLVSVTIETAASAVASASFVLGAGPDGTPPVFAGVTSVAATRTTILCSEGEAVDCDLITPLAGTVLPSTTLAWGAAPDDTTAPAGLLVRVYAYDAAGTLPAEPTSIGFEAHAPRGASCASYDPCTPLPPVNPLAAWSTFCARVEVEDGAGNRAGYDTEACAPVGADEADFDGPTRLCVPAGTATCPTPGTDGGAGTGTDAGAGSGTDAGAADDGVRDGCSCAIAGARTRGATGAWIAALLAAALAGATRGGGATRRRRGRLGA